MIAWLWCECDWIKIERLHFKSICKTHIYTCVPKIHKCKYRNIISTSFCMNIHTKCLEFKRNEMVNDNVVLVYLVCNHAEPFSKKPSNTFTFVTKFLWISLDLSQTAGCVGGDLETSAFQFFPRSFMYLCRPWISKHSLLFRSKKEKKTILMSD